MRSCPRTLPRRQPLVVLPEQLERPIDVVLAPDPVADPTGPRQHVVHLRRTSLDQLLPHPHRKREIGHPFAVKVPDLMPVHPKLDTTKPVRPRFDPRPRPKLALDLLPDTCHVTLLSRRYLVSRLTKSYHRSVRF